MKREIKKHFDLTLCLILLYSNIYHSQMTFFNSAYNWKNKMYVKRGRSFGENNLEYSSNVEIKIFFFYPGRPYKSFSCIKGPSVNDVTKTSRFSYPSPLSPRSH